MAKNQQGSGEDGGYLLGQVRAPTGEKRPNPIEVRALHPEDGSELLRIPIDSGGRFLIRRAALGETNAEAVELQVFGALGKLLAREVRAIPRQGAGTFTIWLREEAGASRRPSPHPPLGEASGALVSSQTIDRLATVLKESVSEQDGRPLVPSWVNTTIRDLNALAAVSRQILEGNQAAARPFLDILRSASEAATTASTREAIAFSALPGSGLGTVPSRASGQSRACLLDPAAALEVAAAAFLLDRYRADRLRDLAQPGSYTQQVAAILKEKAQSLEAFQNAALEYQQGHITRDTFGRLIELSGPAGPDEPLAMPSRREPAAPVSPPVPGGGGFPPSLPDLPCGLWVDCVDEIVAAATNYRPPARCPRDEVIGSITPSAICKGATNVELELRPVDGERFSSSGSCDVHLQRAFNHRMLLETLAAAPDVVRVRLKVASLSGCVGFRGAGSGSPGNLSFIGSCFRISRLTTNPVFGLVTAALDVTQVGCTGRNALRVVPPPEVNLLIAEGGIRFDYDGVHGVHPVEASGREQVALSVESCTKVKLSWHFDFGEETAWVDPEEFIRVRITRSDGSIVEDDQPYKGHTEQTERGDETYTLTAVARVNGSECGRTQGTIAIERLSMLHLSTPSRLRIGETGTLKVRSSCPVLTDLKVSLTANRPGSLSVPAYLIIPQGQDESTTQIAALGTGCAEVVVTANATNYLWHSRNVDVYEAPKITGMTPGEADVCGTFELNIEGSCFKPFETTVSAKSGEVTRALEILEITGESIRCRGAGFQSGSWSVTVVSRGLESNARTLSVKATAPEIQLFSATTVCPGFGGFAPCAFRPCQDNWAFVQWIVTNAHRIVIREHQSGGDDENIHDKLISIEGCPGTDTDNFTRSGIRRRTVYQLEAYPVGEGGEPVTRTAEVGARGFKRLRLSNTSGRTLVVWKVEGWFQNVDAIPRDKNNKTTLNDKESMTLTFEDCKRYEVHAIDEKAAKDAGKDPKGDAILFNDLHRGWPTRWIGEANGEDGGHLIM